MQKYRTRHFFGSNPHIFLRAGDATAHIIELGGMVRSAGEESSLY